MIIVIRASHEPLKKLKENADLTTVPRLVSKSISLRRNALSCSLLKHIFEEWFDIYFIFCIHRF